MITGPNMSIALRHVDLKRPTGKKLQNFTKAASTVELLMMVSCSMRFTITVHATQFEPPLTPRRYDGISAALGCNRALANIETKARCIYEILIFFLF